MTKENTATIACFSGLGKIAAMRDHQNKLTRQYIDQILTAKPIMGDARVCKYSAAFMGAATSCGLGKATASMYLSALRFAIANNIPANQFGWNLARLKEKAGTTTNNESAEKGKAERKAMGFAERMRRLINEPEFTAFASFANKLANQGTTIEVIMTQYVSANVK